MFTRSLSLALSRIHSILPVFLSFPLFFPIGCVAFVACPKANRLYMRFRGHIHICHMTTTIWRFNKEATECLCVSYCVVRVCVCIVWEHSDLPLSECRHSSRERKRKNRHLYFEINTDIISLLWCMIFECKLRNHLEIHTEPWLLCASAYEFCLKHTRARTHNATPESSLYWKSKHIIICMVFGEH